MFTRMYRIVEGSTQDLPDVAAFIETLNTLDRHATSEARALFSRAEELFVARAPGRLDVMGGIADYSGSLVLQLPIKEATLVALQTDSSRSLHIVSLGGATNHRTVEFSMPLANFEQNGVPVDYESARNFFKQDPARHWAAYAAGVFLVLMRECSADFPRGARILISSAVPEGKGVSSSAAIEVAVMQAVAAAFKLRIPPREMALLCQKVENLVVGAPCGVMDQMTSVCGEKGKLLALLCQPAEIQGLVPIPPEIAFWGVDSGIRHAVSGSDYTSVRVGAFMGYRILAEKLGLKVERGEREGHVRIRDPRWRGHLANVSPSEFQGLSDALPEEISGREFLEKFQGSPDTVTRIQPEKCYAVRTPASHPVHEHFRVRAFAELLSTPPGPRQLELLGELMFQSHASYSACKLGSEGTDALVRLARDSRFSDSVFGAKITGGGSGGTVALLGLKGAGGAVEEIAAKYAAASSHRPHIFSGSSPGAAAFGYLRLQ